MAAIIKFFDGKKMYIAAGLGVLVGGLQLGGVLTEDQMAPIWAIIGGLGFAGMAGKGAKIANALSGQTPPS